MSEIENIMASTATVEPVTCEEQQQCVSPTVESVASVSSGNSSTSTSASNSDICRYYAKGICRFGDMCRFSHVLDDENTEIDEQSPPATSKSKKLYQKHHLASIYMFLLILSIRFSNINHNNHSERSE